jgi:DNA topoisomerase-3
MKSLIVTEKPSVAADLAKVLGKFKKEDDYFENDTLVIASAVGHLVELFMPQDINPKFKSWRLEDLPIIPDAFELKPIEKSQNKLKTLQKLMARKDIGTVINACDAGREGELIFTYIYQICRCTKPVQRLWMLSMTKQGILDAFESLKPGDTLKPLQDAARCRSESDWLIGINGTRVITSQMFGFRGGQAVTVGRVQTPTLSMIVEREREIKNFISRPFWRVSGQFTITQGTYTGVLQRPDFAKTKDDTNEHDRADRWWDAQVVQDLLKTLEPARTGVVSETKKRSTQLSGRLYDLTTLQREANNRFSLPAGRTLQIVQSLYEKHKMLTYPRTDSRALPEDYGPTCQEVLRTLKETTLGSYASWVLDQGAVNPKNKRIFNNAQISDHFAIIPTHVYHSDLSHDEAKIYDMVARRFIAVFYPAAEYDVTTRLTRVADAYDFKTEGKVLVHPGWLSVYGKEATLPQDDTLPALTPADGTPPQAQVESLASDEDHTRPPARYTEATLLAAMEGAGKLIEDEELADAMKDKGLGTPATRAQIIEHIIAERYIERDHKELIPTNKAEQLVDFLKAADVGVLTNPTLTAQWEHKLKEMEQRKLSRADFMAGIAQLTREIVQKTCNFDEAKAPLGHTAIVSPTDGKPMLETIRTYASQCGKLQINKVMGNRRLTHEEIEQLLRDKTLGPLDGFRSKSGKPFSAMLKLDADLKVKFDFEGSGEDALGGATPTDLSTCEAIGPCPKRTSGGCTGQVYALPNGYACEHQVKKDGLCDFRLSRNLLGRVIEKEQAALLITKGKTDLLDKFKSKRTGRYFSAYLALKPDGQVSFAFEPRAAKPTKAGAGKTKAAAKSVAATAAAALTEAQDTAAPAKPTRRSAAATRTPKAAAPKTAAPKAAKTPAKKTTKASTSAKKTKSS